MADRGVTHLTSTVPVIAGLAFIRGHRYVGPITRPLERPRHYGAEVGTIVAIVGASAALASAGVGAYAASESAAQQAEAAKFNRQVALNEAEAAKNAAALEAKRAREEGETFAARQRALIGASGIEMSGSPLAVLTETAQQAEREAQIIQYGGQVGANARLSQANLYGFAARNARRAGPLNAGTTLLTGVSNAASIYRVGTARKTSDGSGTGAY